LEEAITSDQDEIHSGDLERISIEWKSLLGLIAHAPRVEDARWAELQEAARKMVSFGGQSNELPELPELPVRQRKRFDRISRN